MQRISSLADGLSRLPDTAEYLVLGKSSKVEDIFSYTEMPPSPDIDLALRNGIMQDEEVFSFPAQAQVELKRTNSNCRTFSFIMFISIVGLCTLMVLLRGHIKSLLLWVELQEVWLSFGIFLALFMFVSFPFTWGYVVLNITAGYLYGLIQGVIITSASAAYGIFVAHIFLQRFCSNVVRSRLNNKQIDAILSVLEGKQSFKVVALTRLTPIPFGLQNALFSVTDITLSYYMSASVCGLLPTQFLNTYIGSTLRSMEDVLSDQSTAVTGYMIFASQLVLMAFLMVVVIRSARAELNKTLQTNSNNNTADGEFTHNRKFNSPSKMYPNDGMHIV